MAKQKAASIFGRIPFAYLVGIFILAADLISKYYIATTIPLTSGARYWYPFGGIGVFDNFYGVQFSINHVTNRGAAWGLFSEYQDVLFYFRVALVVGLIVYLLFLNKREEWRMPLVLIVAGALGNILDIFIYGHVIDMFHFVFWGYDYPVFNVADASICIGIGWLMLQSWLLDSKVKSKKKA